ncbi:MAG: serine hydrolase [Lewinellaceae bacterium]|nr:serine hydrolase [Lewinellaceae bacterium]
MRPSVLLSLLILIGWSRSLSSQTYHEILSDIATENHLVGMSVAVLCHAEIQDLYHFGEADLGQGIAVTDSTRYRIASISKTATAVALMQLYEEGLFGLDDDISNYLGYEVRNPSFPNKIISFRMLLSHTSSLQDGNGYGNFLAATYAQSPIPDMQELLLPGGNWYTSNLWRTEAPGTFFQYSNLNFGVIGTLVEKISNRRFDQYLRDSVLLPLGIQGSFNVADLPNINTLAVLYRNGLAQADDYNGQMPAAFNDSTYTVGTNGLLFAPQGGLRVSAAELARFAAMMSNYGDGNNVRILDSATIALMLQPQWTYNGSNGDNYYNLFNQWGLGVQITTNTNLGDIVVPGTLLYGHPGEAYGLISDMYFEVDKQFGIVFITNGYFGSAGYTFGNYSAFYMPEEQIFAAIRDFFFNACDELSLVAGPGKSVPTSIRYRPESNTLICAETLNGMPLQIFDMTGRILYSQSVINNQVSLPLLSPGLYAVVVQGADEVWSQKMFLGSY